MSRPAPARAGRWFLAPCLIRFACAGSAWADGLYAVGLRQTHTIASKETPAVPLAIWYPAAGPQIDAAPAPGPFPVILLSHGSGGSEFGHADWASYLAAHGYIVAAPRHLGDSYDQPDGRGTDVQLIGRVWQAQAALDTVLGDARLIPAIATGRIGMLGYSAGGYTTLVMAGARPDFSLWRTHCEAHAAEDTGLCPPGFWQSLPRITRPGWALPQETRIRAAVVMAPASVFFDQQGLGRIGIPMRLYGARDDRYVINAWNVDRVAAALVPPAAVHRVPGGHYVFLAPCSSDLLARRPELCTDAAGVDRVAIHRQMEAELLDFFNANL